MWPWVSSSCPSYLGVWGGRICSAQEFKTSLGTIVRSPLKTNKPQVKIWRCLCQKIILYIYMTFYCFEKSFYVHFIHKTHR
jgi:hypothetical protein